jgi:NADH-quinone oxidoreductase subunit N
MTITAQDLIPLLPLLFATGLSVLVMLLIAIKRDHTLTCASTIIGLAICIPVTLAIIDYAGAQVTPLLLIDSYSLFFTIIVLIIAAFIAVFSYPYLYRLRDEVEEFYLLLLLATVGAITMVSSNHFISAFLGLETLAISLYAMVAYPIHGKAVAQFPLEAGIKYLVLSAVASATMLFGIALIYSLTGTLSFSDLSGLSLHGEGVNQGLLVTALLLLIGGMAFKLSLVPFHIWTPDVYEGSPLPATVFLATTGKAAMFALLLRIMITTQALTFEAVIIALSLIAVLSMLIGNVLALLQENLKRILAYSSIAHMGYLMVALLAVNYASSTIGVEAVSFYLIAYIIMTLGAFGVVLVVSSSEKEFDFISDYQGLFWREPWLAALFTAMLLSLAGIPLTVGFIGKFYLVLAGVEAALWVLLALLVIGSGIGIYYYLRIIYRMLQPAEDAGEFRETGWASIGSFAVLAFLLFALLVLGIYPSFLMSIIQTISASL